MEQKKINESLRGHFLYEFQACPFCVKVRRHMKRIGVDLPLRDAKVDPFRTELASGGGKLQVPCLKIEKPDGSVQWMYESNDIIAYLDKAVS